MAGDQDPSPDSRSAVAKAGQMSQQTWETTRRAFVEFLTIPTLVIGGFLLLDVVMFFVDASFPAYGADAQRAWGGLFTDAQATRDFLGVIAGSIITVTSITLSLLLIAVQQGAASLTSLVFDQFLRRRTNQLYFGFFIGLALYSLIVLATINPSHQPIYGVALAGVMTVVALYMLILLIYTTINQMRPVVIIKSIHDHTLVARECQHDLLQITRRAPRLPGAAVIRVTADCSGFLTRIDVKAIAKAIAGDAEVVILGSIGEYVAFGDPIAEIRAVREVDNAAWVSVIRKALSLEGQRDLDTDPAFGIEQLVTIGWTSISTAKSNPSPGLMVIWNLRDLLARWLHADAAFGASDDVGDPDAAIVYRDDLPERLMKGFESLGVVASESMQHQSAAEVYRTFASLFHRLPPQLQRQADDVLLRSLSGLGDHILTSELESALTALIEALAKAGRSQSSVAIGTARQLLECSVGRLNSRSTRTEAGGDHRRPGN